MNTGDKKNPGDDKKRPGKKRPGDDKKKPGEDKKKSEENKKDGEGKSIFSKLRRNKQIKSDDGQAAGPSGTVQRRSGGKKDFKLGHTVTVELTRPLLVTWTDTNTPPEDSASDTKSKSSVKGSFNSGSFLSKLRPKPASSNLLSKDDCFSNKKKKSEQMPTSAYEYIYRQPNPEKEIRSQPQPRIPPPSYKRSSDENVSNEDKALVKMQVTMHGKKTRSASIRDNIPEQSGSKSSLLSMLTLRSNEPAIPQFIVPRRSLSQSPSPSINPEIYKEAIDEGNEASHSEKKSKSIFHFLTIPNRNRSRSPSPSSMSSSQSSTSKQKGTRNTSCGPRISISPTRQIEGNIGNPSTSSSSVDECTRELHKLSPGKYRDRSPVPEGAPYRSSRPRDRNVVAERSASRTRASSSALQHSQSSLPNQQGPEIRNAGRPSTSFGRRSRSRITKLGDFDVDKYTSKK